MFENCECHALTYISQQFVAWCLAQAPLIPTMKYVSSKRYEFICQPVVSSYNEFFQMLGSCLRRASSKSRGFFPFLQFSLALTGISCF